MSKDLFMQIREQEEQTDKDKNKQLKQNNMEQLIKIQSELKVPKGNFNAFGKYKYRSAEDILEAAKPILNKHKCLLNLSDNIESIGSKLFLKATAILYFEGKQVVSFGYAELADHKGMSAEQCTGTASSYARKYALNGLFLIDETESDADSKTITETKTLTFKTEQEIKDAYASGQITKEAAIKYKELLTKI